MKHLKKYNITTSCFDFFTLYTLWWNENVICVLKPTSDNDLLLGFGFVEIITVIKSIKITLDWQLAIHNRVLWWQIWFVEIIGMLHVYTSYSCEIKTKPLSHCIHAHDINLLSKQTVCELSVLAVLECTKSFITKIREGTWEFYNIICIETPKNVWYKYK